MVELTTLAGKTVRECDEHIGSVSDPWVPAEYYTIKIRNIREEQYPDVYPNGGFPDYPGRAYLRGFCTVEGTGVSFNVNLEPEDLGADPNVQGETAPKSRSAYKRWANYVNANNLQGASLDEVCEHMTEIGCRWKVGLMAVDANNNSTFPRSNDEVKQAMSEGRTLKNYLDSRPRSVKAT